MHAKAAVARRSLAGRGLLVLLAAWALLLVGPDLIRLVRPLGSLGFAADNDGLIYDVQGPFPTLADSPAWRAGLRVGDYVDLRAMRCTWPPSAACADLLAVVGGMGGPQRIAPGRTVSLIVKQPGQTPHSVEMAAAPIPVGWTDKAVLVLDEIVAILVILGAGWLVWTRPGPMTWGFFLYAIWFNSGADFEAYAWLEEHPVLLVAQVLVQSVVVTAAYVGLLVFALRVPRDQTEHRWRLLERTLPLIAIVLFGLQLLSFGAAFGYPSETVARASFIAGTAIDVMVLAILLARRHGQPPQDYQRLRWVIWGCLIGLPAFIFAESLSSSSMFLSLVGAPLSDATLGLFYLLNGILVAFVFEAVRRPRVIDVGIPLRRVTLFALLVSVPLFWLGEQVSALHEELHLPVWAWLLGGGLIAFALTRIHDVSAELTHHMLSPGFRRARHRLAQARYQLRGAGTPTGVEFCLTEAPATALHLASAALFRLDEGGWRRCAGAIGWDGSTATRLAPEMQNVLGMNRHPPHPRRLKHVAGVDGFPPGLQAPVFSVPVGDGLAIALYGPHRSGADLSADERELLVRFAGDAAGPYARLEIAALRARVRALEAQPEQLGAMS
jgi:hypothetical protein